MQRLHPSLTRGILVVVGMIFLAGCGSPLPTLTGKVTVGGEPPPAVDDFFGQIALQLEEGGPITISPIDADGSYSIMTGGQSGLKAGKYKVAVSGMVGVPRELLPGQTDDGTRKWVPVEYADFATSGLTYEVQPGKNEWDLDIPAPGAS